jgi:NAD(P)-dependent dehydrogenase (short-subunit alcohol dehydrogenase family)
MKIIVIGGTGTIGKAVVKKLSSDHEIIIASKKNSDFLIDITDIESIKKMYEKIKNIDAIAITTGNVHFAPLLEMTNELYKIGIQSKLMGQINIVLEGIKHLNDNGSFSLISGILNHDPILSGTSAAIINGGIDSFVKSAAIDMPRGIRINAISPTILEESLDAYGPYFKGFKPTSSQDVALSFCKSIEGGQTGQVYKVGY